MFTSEAEEKEDTSCKSYWISFTPNLPSKSHGPTGPVGLSFIYLHHKKKKALPVNHLCCLFFHSSSKEFSETGKMDVQDGCRSDSYPFSQSKWRMQCCPQSSSISSLLRYLLHVINHTYCVDSELHSKTVLIKQ